MTCFAAVDLGGQSGRAVSSSARPPIFPGVTALLTPDLFTFWLTGARCAERTIVSTTEQLDTRTGDWALERARCAGYASEASADGLTGVGMDRVHLPGGGSRVTALARSTARATGPPVVAGPAEATSIGNLMVQAVAAGAFDSLDSARAATDHGSDGPFLLEPAC